jgi:septal ring-binding cell division protein DamX
MSVTEDRPAPYATTSSIIDIVSRYRNRGLPFPVTAEVLARAGISDSLIPRTMQSLQTLDLINDAGNPTETLEGIRLAPEAEYKTCLANWLKGTYAGIFAFVDPSKDDGIRIRDAFRGYKPIGQQDRMVALFEGLCAEAGLINSKPATPRPASATPRPRTTTSASTTVRAALKPKAKTSSASELPAALAGLLASLPAEGNGWTAATRKKFLTTFESVLDFCFPIEDESPSPKDDE